MSPLPTGGLNARNVFAAERVEQLEGVFEGAPRGSLAYSFPLVNVYESKDDITVNAELPGLARDQVAITFSDNVLTLSGTRKPAMEESDRTVVVRQERSLGGFEKSFRIPVRVEADKITAAFKDGILTVTLPKAEEAKPKQIQINVG
ncbi:MAG: Hsp20 family protein [Chitinivibrionales bacterium]|nr:Hsp20 family protein [Chitinivibrionales bacterium]MBD3395199.1 Hsp20 family protein [Chitinivibrionales bacterium]